MIEDKKGTAFVGAGSAGKRHRAYFRADGGVFDLPCKEDDERYILHDFIANDDNVTCKNCLKWEEGDTV